MKAYQLHVTVIDRNGVRVMSDNYETLGDFLGRHYLTRRIADEAAIDAFAAIESTGLIDPQVDVTEIEIAGLVKGQRYDQSSVSEAGYTLDDPGYQLGDYFDAAGRYLGSDEHGIEPTLPR